MGGNAPSTPPPAGGEQIRDRRLLRYAWWAIGVALAGMALKVFAWLVTDSVGLLSDALESSVNLVAGIVMLVALVVSARPPDDDHQFGHQKAELVSAALEGLMIVAAASLIVWSAVDRLVNPAAVENVGVGLAVSGAAAALNLVAGLVLVRAGRAHRSGALTADGQHLLVDVWTTAGVIVAVFLVAVTGWQVLDPAVALLVAANVAVTGGRVLARSVGGLMDPTLPPEELHLVGQVLERYERQGIRFHALRTRAAGHRRFVSVHVLVPGAWTVKDGHALLERVEKDLHASLGQVTVFTHLEPVEDPTSYQDEALDRSIDHG